LDSSPIEKHIRIGSFSARAYFEARADAVVFNELFKDSVRDPSETDARVDAELHWRHVRAGKTAQDIPPDGLRVERIDVETWRVESEFLQARLENCAPFSKIWVSSYPHTLSDLEWRVHLSVVFHKLLLALGRIYLHAGAVKVGEAASAFIGDKGSGKSTICLWLGRAGATILSDDHISVHRRDGAFYASGCEQVARVTAKTEAALLPDMLTVEPRDFAGTLKKEFTVADWFAVQPYQDVFLRKVFFPHVGSRWQVRALSPRHLTARLLESTRMSHRFANTEDYVRHLDLFSALAEQVEGFEIELSPNLNELAHLAAFLDA
jgi:hypothetical protein